MTDATELDEAAIRARSEACLRGFEAEVPAHWYGQADVVARALRKEYGPGGIYDADAAFIVACSPSVVLAALDEITRLRAALDEALSDHLCACGYGVVCGQCQRVDRARAEAAEKALDEARAEVECEREYADADTRTATEMATRALAAESALATVRAGLTEALDELVECRSFISVETRHYPTVHAINEVVEHLRPLATPTTMERNKG